MLEQEPATRVQGLVANVPGAFELQEISPPGVAPVTVAVQVVTPPVLWIVIGVHEIVTALGESTKTSYQFALPALFVSPEYVAVMLERPAVLG